MVTDHFRESVESALYWAVEPRDADKEVRELDNSDGALVVRVEGAQRIDFRDVESESVMRNGRIQNITVNEKDGSVTARFLAVED
jgi:hypothetical protein